MRPDGPAPTYKNIIPKLHNELRDERAMRIFGSKWVLAFKVLVVILQKESWNCGSLKLSGPFIQDLKVAVCGKLDVRDMTSYWIR
jgi:hypothetical protein